MWKVIAFRLTILNELKEKKYDNLHKLTIHDKNFIIAMIIKFKNINHYEIKKLIDFNSINIEIKKDKDIIINFLQHHSDLISKKYIGEHFSNDIDVITEAFKYKTIKIMLYVNTKSECYYTLGLKALEHSPHAFKYLDERFTFDRDIVLKYANGFKYADKHFRDDKEIVIKAIKFYANITDEDRKYYKSLKDFHWNPSDVYYIGDELRKDKEVMLLALQLCPRMYYILNDELKSDRDIAMKSIENNQFIYPNIPKDLQDDKEITLIAVKGSGQLLYFSSDRLKDDKEVVLQALEKNTIPTYSSYEAMWNDDPYDQLRDPEGIKELNYRLETYKPLEFVSKRLCDDDEIIVKSIKVWKPQSLRFASERLRNTKKIYIQKNNRIGLFYEHNNEYIYLYSLETEKSKYDCTIPFDYKPYSLGNVTIKEAKTLHISKCFNNEIKDIRNGNIDTDVYHEYPYFI